MYSYTDIVGSPFPAGYPTSYAKTSRRSPGSSWTTPSACPFRVRTR